MAQVTVIARTTAAVVTQVPVQSDKYPHIFLLADNLAGAEEIDVYIMAGNTWVLVADPATGTPIRLTAAIPSQVFRGGALYGVLKDATVGACGVYVDYGTRGY